MPNRPNLLVVTLVIVVAVFSVTLCGCDEVAGSVIAGDGGFDLDQLSSVIDLTTKSLQLFRELSNNEAGTIRASYQDLRTTLKTGASEPSGGEGDTQTENPTNLSVYLNQKDHSGLLTEMNARSADMRAKADAATEALHATANDAQHLFGLLDKRCNDITDVQLRAKAQADVSETRNAFYSKLDVAQSALAEAEKSISRYKDIEAYLEVEIGKGHAQEEIADLDSDVKAISALNKNIQAAVDDGMRMVEAQRDGTPRRPSQAEEEPIEGMRPAEQTTSANKPQDADSAVSMSDAPANGPAPSVTPTSSAAPNPQVVPAPVPVAAFSAPVSRPWANSSIPVGVNRPVVAISPNQWCACQQYAANVQPHTFYARPRYFRPSRWARFHR